MTIFGFVTQTEGEAAPRYSTEVKPISYSEAKAVIQDIASCEETLALLKILALGSQEIEAGKVKPVGDVAAQPRAKHTGC